MSKKEEIKMSEEAIAALIVNTKRTKRKLNLIDIAKWIDVARESLGSLKAVSEAIDVSEEMLRQFSLVKKLGKRVKLLIEERKIDSVDVVYRLSKLRENEQLIVAEEFVNGDINSMDVRAIVSLKRKAPELSINDIIEKVKSTRNIKEYVAMFLIPQVINNIEELERLFSKVVGKKNITDIKITGPIGVLIINSEGSKNLQRASKLHGLTKRNFINKLLSKEVK